MEPFGPTRRVSTCLGLTLVEITLTMVAIAIIASVLVPSIGGIRTRVQLVKLQNDVDRINDAIDIYRASGGDLGDLKEPQAILDRLKSVRLSSSANQYVGLTGSTIDRRLAARVIQGSSQNVSRAVWNPSQHRFVIDSRGSGVVEFYLDDRLAEIDYGEETRKNSALDYNGDPGWIWSYRDRPNPAATATGPPGVPVASVPEAPLPPALAAPVKLREPAILPGGGTFKPSEFPQTVTVSNPNDPSTWLMVSIDGGAYFKYSAPLSITGNATLVAFATGSPDRWISSQPTVATFRRSDPVRLLPPTISLSANQFDDDTPLISVSLSDPNPSGQSRLFYTIVPPGGTTPPRSGWSSYTGPLSLSANTYPSGFTAIAYAWALDPVDYQDSDSSSRSAGADFIFEDPGLTDVLYIIDVSGSMATKVGGSTRIDLVVAALTDAINRLSSQARFSVTTFGGDLEWTDGSLELKTATDANKQGMIAQVSQFKADSSGTNYEAALRSPFLFSQKPQLVYFLTDGQPTAGGDFADEVDTLAAAGIQVNTIGVDLDSAATSRLAGIASKTKGKSKVVKND